MRKTRFVVLAAVSGLVAACASAPSPMGFFVTSAGSGKGADLGGLAGADALCQRLAGAAGQGARQWRAYLSTPPTFAQGSTPAVPAVNARDRIGTGPWYNAKGELIAENLEALHGAANAIAKATALSEKGEVVNGRGDQPNRHDVLTGSLPDGTAAPQTCEDWTSGGADTAGMVGHHDRTGLDDSDAAKSWNSSHASRGGCGLEALRGTGGDGLFYCFATD